MGLGHTLTFERCSDLENHTQIRIPGKAVAQRLPLLLIFAIGLAVKALRREEVDALCALSMRRMSMISTGEQGGQPTPLVGEAGEYALLQRSRTSGAIVGGAKTHGGFRINVPPDFCHDLSRIGHTLSVWPKSIA